MVLLSLTAHRITGNPVFRHWALLTVSGISGGTVGDNRTVVTSQRMVRNEPNRLHRTGEVPRLQSETPGRTLGRAPAYTAVRIKPRHWPAGSIAAIGDQCWYYISVGGGRERSPLDDGGQLVRHGRGRTMLPGGQPPYFEVAWNSAESASRSGPAGPQVMRP